MMQRPILSVPDARLKQISAPIETITAEIQTLALDLCDSLYQAQGLGLAAIQIGDARRMIAVAAKAFEGTPDGVLTRHESALVLINPQIVATSAESLDFREGCLSVPQIFADVTRPAGVSVTYRRLDGSAQRLEAEGLLAICLQHEIDHLNGIVFLDHLSRLKRERALQALKKRQQRA